MGDGILIQHGVKKKGDFTGHDDIVNAPIHFTLAKAVELGSIITIDIPP
jgi:hypothetical protein